MQQKQILRNAIRNLVSSIAPIDDLEKDHLAFVLSWIDTGTELFRIHKPANPPIHLVSYFLVFDPDNSSILLVDHKNAGLWLPSGGHVEKDEHPRDTVLRECTEELGIEADFIWDEPYFLTVTQTVGTVEEHTDVSFWYLLKGRSTQSLNFDREEFHGIKWFTLNEIPYERTDPHMKRCMDKLAQRLFIKTSP
jgi:8-oxo-dGTP pyrophosphatase MutT (NUDIX family)